MSDVKSKFTLYAEYKDFVPRKTPIVFKSLSPRLNSVSQCLPMAFITFFILPLFLFWLIGSIGMKLTQDRFVREGNELTGIITSCAPVKSTQNVRVYYSYTFSSVRFSDSQILNGPCENYVAGDSMKISPGGANQLIVPFMMICGIPLVLLFLYQYVKTFIDFFYAWPNRSRLRTKGVLLEGEITSISDNKHKLRTRRPLERTTTYRIFIEYQFETPRKKILTGYTEAHRQDLLYQPLPPVGTPVTVLYADDHTHLML
jgi:hypothetical protein